VQAGHLKGSYLLFLRGGKSAYGSLGDPIGLLFELADEDTNSVDGPPDPVGTLSSSFTNSRSP
jgi:hypothetical protein